MQTRLKGRDLITTQEWTKDELDALLVDDAEAFAVHYGVKPDGNAHDPHGVGDYGAHRTVVGRAVG